ncbi:MAG TPA: GNAT family N-acetyltransferase [Saprospiraceae bacterium]|nr:GNAT family N-acetyltransferase [Saprospiraceae bacterium]
MSMKITKATKLSAELKDMICQLWNMEYPQKLAITPTAFDEFLEASASQTHFLIMENEKDLAGWAYTFDRDGDRWFSIIISHAHQGKGLGHVLLNLIKEKETQLNGWVIDHPHDRKQNGQPYLSPLSFYVKNGFTALPDTRLENEKISAVKIEWKKQA